MEIVASCSLVGLVNNISSANIRENTSFLPNKILHTAQGYTRAYIAFPCRLSFSFCIISCFPLIPPSPPTHTHARYLSFLAFPHFLKASNKILHVYTGVVPRLQCGLNSKCLALQRAKTDRYSKWEKSVINFFFCYSFNLEIFA